MPPTTAFAAAPVLVPSAPGTTRPVPRPARPLAPALLRPLLHDQFLSWTLAICLLCLTMGLVGLAEPVIKTIPLLADSDGPEGTAIQDLALMEMPAAAPAAQEEATLAPTEILPPSELLEQVAEMLPEPLEWLETPETPLTLEDVLEVPQAPPIEAMLTPAKPPAPRPPPQVRSASPRPANAPQRSTSSASSSSSLNGLAGSGGNGSGGGSSTGYFPAPPYPASARSRGMQGTVYLNLTFGADGRVVSATVSRSSGYSYLDQTAADWARRNWRGSKGQTGTYRKPVQFRLR